MEKPDDESSLWRQRLDGGIPQKIATHADRFAVSQTGVLYTRAGDTRTVELRNWNAATGKDSLAASLPVGLFYGITASPDGRMVILARMDRPTGDVMMIEPAR